MAIFIGIITMYYTQQLAKELANEEQKKMRLWANAYQNINTADEFTDIGYYFEVIQSNTTVPVIMTDEKDSILLWRNLDTSKVLYDSNFLKKELQSMKKFRQPITIELLNQHKNHIYYNVSGPLKKLKLYPIIQLIIIAVFLVLAYLVFTGSRNAEQNRIWVGLAKETAHQLGTPISSLSAWLDYFRVSKEINHEAIKELEKDVIRLEQITDRFSKIGAVPHLDTNNLSHTIQKNIDYIKKRSSGEVTFLLNVEPDLLAKFSPPLFDWVFENLLKNALDALQGKGKIKIEAGKRNNQIFIEVTDSGKGIPRSQQSDVFKAGYSTKKRGWGLGLTLVKRIVEEYHKGKIFIKYSEIHKGTTFRIEMKA